MKTFRRDKLRRLCESGRLVLVESYHFDDMTGSESTTKEMPVAILPKDWTNRKEGICYLHTSDFDSSCGRSWMNDDGTVYLKVHSNCSYTFGIKEES